MKKLKFMRPEEVEEMNRLSNEELLKKLAEKTREVEAHKKLKKDDVNIKSLSAEIKKHKDSHDLKEKIDELSQEIKGLRSSVMEEVFEKNENLKSLRKGYDETIKRSKEELDMLVSIHSKRPR
tara:strand:- start:10979 stop:11347 length:369 start_codon:yes stop_codon:yes gene_type:complete